MSEIYTTQAAVIERFGENLLTRLTVENPTEESVVETNVLDKAITAVDGLISSFLRDKYTLPLSEVPPELEDCAQNLVLEKIYSGKPERETPKNVTDRAAAAMTWLKDIKKGLASLSVATLAPAPGTNSETGSGFFRTSKKVSDRIFSDTVLDSFTGRNNGR
jgi:phage gp36-like protein